MTDQKLKDLAASIEPWVVETRRALHRIPEIGFQEFKTQQLIKDTLDELSIPYTTHRTWVIGLIEGGHPGATIGLRADIDALPITEPEHEFSSTHPGRMHACGHDAHTAVLLGTAKLLSSIKDELHGNVKLLFQPAEEAEGGARPMIEAGALQDPEVKRIYGIHVQPYLPSGTIETRVGALNASTDTFKITVHGESGHGAYPEYGRDAILAAANIITSLHQITSRNVSPLDSAVITVGQINAGVACNVLCGEATIVGTLRAITPETRALINRRMREVAEHTAIAMGCTAEIIVDDGFSPLVNHQQPVERILAVGERLLGAEHVLVKDAPSMGGEDYAYFLEAIPGAFYHLGCAKPGATTFHSLHNENFSIDEDCLKYGIMMQSALVLDALEEENAK